MYGEFLIKVTEPKKVLPALAAIFPNNNLAATLASSQFKNYPPNIYAFGVSQPDVHLLVAIFDRVVQVSIDNHVNPKDLSQIKDLLRRTAAADVVLGGDKTYTI